jgi:hypothetical protein
VCKQRAKGKGHGAKSKGQRAKSKGQRANGAKRSPDFQDNEATVVWLGNHQEYESNFKNNKETIRKWLKKNNWI